MRNKILVLGATGNIGSFLVGNLKKKDASFVAGVQTEAGKKKLQQDEILGVTLDFGDPESLNNAMKGIKRLVMLTPASEQMVSWGKNIIEAAKRNGIKFILRSSLMDTNPYSPHLLFRLHGHIDAMLRDSGIPYAIVQPNIAMQNFVEYWAAPINSDNAFYFMHGDSRVSYIDLRDVAEIETEIINNPMNHEKREYTITGPESLSDTDIARTLSNAVGRTIRYIPLDESQYVAKLRKMGMAEWDINIQLSLEHRVTEQNLSIISDETQSITGKTSTTFEQFAWSYAQEWKKARVSV